MSTLLGNLESFDEKTEDWSSYIERVEQFFIANGVKEEKHVPTLLSVIGGKTYTLLRNLSAPVKPAERSFKEIVELLRKHLSPKPLVIAERFRFHRRDQLSGESISNYVAELKKLSEHCAFGDSLKDSLRDRLVCGMRNENIQKKLLSVAELTFDRAFEIAIAMETAARDAIELQNKPVNASTVPVNKVKAQPSRSHSDSSPNYCFRCGKLHNPQTCRFKNAVCHKCKKTGHIQVVCRSKSDKSTYIPQKKEKRRGVHVFEDQDFENSDSDEFSAFMGCLEVNNMYNKASNVIWVEPEIEGKPFKMELDTGSAISVIPYNQYKELFSNVKLSKSQVTLKTYTGEKVVPKGVINCNVKFKDQQKRLNLQVVETPGPALFGRDWLSEIRLDWGEIKTLKLSQTQSECKLKELEEMLKEYESVFTDGIGTLKEQKANLKVKENCQPRFHKARQVPYALRPKVEAELRRLEEEGILSKVKYSEWATPIVPVMKRNGSVRICGDFKVSINPVLLAEQYPLPRIEDIFANLSGGQHFSKLDLKQAYHQMEVTEESKKYLTINTHKGLFKYNRLVFGVTSSPAIWQRAIDQVLQGIPGTQCILDDMIITGRTDEEHLQNLKMVLQRLQDAGLKANREKCEFFKDRVQFCGHEIDKQGLHKTGEKVEAIVNAPHPENVGQLRSFLGLVNYYNRFLPNLATLLHPLHQLLEQGNKWQWTEECEQAFSKAKRLITSKQVLTHYDPALPVTLACDASPTGIGAVLSHIMPDGSERPVAFASRSLTKTERKYAQIDKEALSIVWGVKKFHVYLFGRSFTLITDHKPLESIFNPEKGVPAMTAARLQRYALFLAGFEYNIEYKSTKNHCNADGLSRLPLQQEEKGEEDLDSSDVFYSTQFDPLPVTCELIAKETQRDPELARVYEAILKGWSQHTEGEKPYHNRRNELSVHQGCILWGMRVVIPPKLQARVLEELHDSHLGIVKMKALARSYVWWPGMNEQLEELAKACSGCQQNLNMPSKVSLHPWEWATTPWQRIHIDYAGPFQGSMFLVVVDAHSKWPEVIPMKSTSSAKTIEVLRNLFARFGIPQQIVSDNGPQFVSEEFQLFAKANGIRHITSAPYHPATNGLAERSVQTFKRALRSMSESSSSVREKLAKFLMAYRNTPHATTGESPAMLMIKRPLRTRLDLVKPSLNKKMENKQMKQILQSAIAKRSQPQQLVVGDTVLARDYRGDLKWRSGLVVQQTGPLMYKVQVAPDMIWRRHIEQLLPTHSEKATVRLSGATLQEPVDISLPEAPGANFSTDLPSCSGSETSQTPVCETDPAAAPAGTTSVSIDTPQHTPAPQEVSPATPQKALSSPPKVQERRYPIRNRKALEKLNL